VESDVLFDPPQRQIFSFALFQQRLENVAQVRHQKIAQEHHIRLTSHVKLILIDFTPLIFHRFHEFCLLNQRSEFVFTLLLELAADIIPT